MKLFDLELPAELAAVIAAHAEREYPNEACGVIVGPAAQRELARVEPLRNVQDRYHRLDPVRFWRTARDAFRIDELERMRLLERLELEGLVERVVYHSHPDAGAYFSPEDRASVVVDGVDLLPGVMHLVVSVVRGTAGPMAAFRYDADRQAFDETQLAEESSRSSWPNFEARAMEGREAARPVAPVAGRLVRLLATAAELEHLTPRAKARELVSASTMNDLRCLALGYHSPALGFPLVEIPGWPPPIELPGAHGDELVELIHEGTTVAVVAGADERAFRPVAVSPAAIHPRDRDAADVRAELLRRGVLDAILSVTSSGQLAVELGADRIELPVIAPDDPRTLAIFAQNLGATRIRPMGEGIRGIGAT